MTTQTPIALLLLAIAWVAPFAISQEPALDRPSARSGYSIAYDRHRERLVVFGGYDKARLSDTWEWDGSRWHRLATGEGGPAARLDAAMVYDEERKVCVLFGGSARREILGDTWTWDGRRWMHHEVEGPPARKLSCMAYDAKRKVSVLFGGQGKKRLKDTWEWNGRAWRQAAAGKRAPAARGAHELVFDRKRGRTILHGGYSILTHEDVWAFDGSSWTKLPDAAAGPRLHFAMGYDEEREQVVVFGGFDEEKRVQDTWEWDGDLFWASKAGTRPEARAEHDGTYVPGLGFVVFGGVFGQGMAPGDRKRLADLWVWNGKFWKKP